MGCSLARQRCEETLNERAAERRERNLKRGKRREERVEAEGWVEGPAPKSIFKAAPVPVKI